MRIDLTKYNNIVPWLERCKAELLKYDYEEIVDKPLEMMAEFLKGKFD